MNLLLQRGLVYTHFISTEGRDVVIVGRVSELDSVLTGFGLTAQGTFSIGDTEGWILIFLEFLQKAN